YTPARTPIDVSAWLDGEKLVVEVADSGPGLVPGTEAKIFEKFYRAEPRPGDAGVGLGLTICRSIVRTHGGTIWAENRPEGGTSFRFALPLADRSVSATPAAPPA